MATHQAGSQLIAGAQSEQVSGLWVPEDNQQKGDWALRLEFDGNLIGPPHQPVIFSKVAYGGTKLEAACHSK